MLITWRFRTGPGRLDRARFQRPERRRNRHEAGRTEEGMTMRDFVCDQDGKSIATIRDGEMIDADGRPVGAVRNKNVYDKNGKFIFHLQPPKGEESVGWMTDEAVFKLLHQKSRS
jgi:hypothetical protein